jgi:leucyl-tRNA synthetase
LKCNKRAILEDLIVVLSPFAPHIAEELWHLLGHQESIVNATYPVFNEEYILEDAFEYPIMVNGKLRAKIVFAVTSSEEEIREGVVANEQVRKWTEGRPLKKIIVVPKKIVNVVV